MRLKCIDVMKARDALTGTAFVGDHNPKRSAAASCERGVRVSYAGVKNAHDRRCAALGGEGWPHNIAALFASELR